MNRNNLKIISSLLLLLTAFIWGIAFVAQSVGMDHVGPWTFVFFRFTLSSLALLPVSVIAGRKLKKDRISNDTLFRGSSAGLSCSETAELSCSEAAELSCSETAELSCNEAAYISCSEAADISCNEAAYISCNNQGTGHCTKKTVSDYIRGGVLCGVFLGVASISQQAGLQYTTAGKAGFITALYVVLVPVLGLIIGRKPPGKVWFCVILGIAGLYLISVKEGFSIGAGDALCMLCALLFSCQIMSVDHFSSRLENMVLLSNIQFVIAAFIGGAGMLIFESPSWDQILAAALPIAYAGILSGAVGYTLQIIAQKNTDPAVASLLMSLESVFSAFAGWILLGQVLTGREFAGCALVMVAVVLAQVPVEHILRRKS